MQSAARVLIHPSQFPGQVQRDLMNSLRARALNHKFLYDGIKQTRKWLALHQACSPSRTDPECEAVYDQAFEATVPHLEVADVHLLGLGCGGGQKDTRALQLLVSSGKRVAYTPVDVSTPMVLAAREYAMARVRGLACAPVVCDLTTAPDLPEMLANLAVPGAQRLVTCFGLIPNFEPEAILPSLASLVKPADLLLLSANLSPGPDYAEGTRRILPLYDNQPTRDWLLGFLFDLGAETGDGDFLFAVENASAGLKRIVARFQFNRTREIRVGEDQVSFHPGDSLRLFFSYRYNPALIRKLFAQHRLEVLRQWVAPSEEEGVFLMRACAPG